AFVHDVPLADYLRPNPQLKDVLVSLPERKFIFTNADVNHARRVLKYLNIEECFEGIIDVVALNPYCKPMLASFKIAMQMAGVEKPEECVMIDDIPRTTRAAREQGFYSVLYGVDEFHPDADAFLTDWSTLPTLLRERK
ncbi:MAG: HAD-IA family hydrolase, partial [Chloroflexota bacterium]